MINNNPEMNMDSEQIVKVKAHLVVVGDRFRKDLGDLQSLADSMNSVGQLQPIGIDANYNLIWGQRRLKAAESLGWERIQARIINLDDPLKAEHDENEERKPFTLDERVAIGEALEQSLPERRGGDRKSDEFQSAKNCTLNDGVKTRQLAAEKAGFGNPETYRQAKTIVKNGIPELRQSVDAGEISISAAAKVAQKPLEEQTRIVQLPTAKEARKQATETGKWVEARDGKTYTPKTESQEAWEKSIGERVSAVHASMERIQSLSKEVSPEQFIKDLEAYQGKYNSQFLEQRIHQSYGDAMNWLDEFRQLWEQKHHAKSKVA